jgi:uncharacterized Zn finger protein (UPF0148 family)
MSCKLHGYTNNVVCPACDLETIEKESMNHPSTTDPFGNLRDPEERHREEIRMSKVILKHKLQGVLDELEYLINSTPTGEERNKLCDMNIHAQEIEELRKKLS